MYSDRKSKCHVNGLVLLKCIHYSRVVFVLVRLSLELTRAVLSCMYM